MQYTVFYTVFFKHTAPHTTWGDDPRYASYPEEVRTAKVWGDQAGKTIGDQMFMKVITASDPREAQRIVEADAIAGWGTIVFLVFEGVLAPVIKNDLVIELRPS